MWGFIFWIIVIFIIFIVIQLLEKKNKWIKKGYSEENELDNFLKQNENVFYNYSNNNFEEERIKRQLDINSNEIKYTREKTIIYNERKKYQYKVNNIMTYRELWFFKRIKEYFRNDPEINIFTKIRLADLISAENNLNYWEKQSLFNKINRKHIDFVISDTNGKIKCLIELDDYTHRYMSKTIENDKFKDEVFEELWIPLLRFKIWETWDFSIIKEKWI